MKQSPEKQEDSQSWATMRPHNFDPTNYTSKIILKEPVQKEDWTYQRVVVDVQHHIHWMERCFLKSFHYIVGAPFCITDKLVMPCQNNTSVHLKYLQLNQLPWIDINHLKGEVYKKDNHTLKIHSIFRIIEKKVAPIESDSYLRWLFP